MLLFLRNFAIIALIALGLTFLPAGSNIVTGVLAALSLLLLGAVAMLAIRYWRESTLTRDTMTDRQRGLVYGGLGAIALLVAGTDELFDTGAGTVVWLALMAGAVWLVIKTWRDAATL